MKKSLSLLKIEAETSCLNRGHKIDWRMPIKLIWHRGSEQLGSCKYCGMYVEILDNPSPNQIDIGGEAIALNCPES